MAFFGEACVEVVAVVITFLFISTVNYCRQCSEKKTKSLKKVAELEEETTMESVDASTSESIELVEVEKEKREFNEVAERMAGRMAGLLQQLVEIEDHQESPASVSPDASATTGSVDRVDDETEWSEWNEVAERMAGRMTSLLQDLVEVEDDEDSVEHYSGADEIKYVDNEAKKGQWKRVAERRVELLDRDADASSNASTDYVAEASLRNDDDMSDEDMDSLEWDDVSFKMGRVFEQFAELDIDEDEHKVFEPISSEQIMPCLLGQSRQDALSRNHSSTSVVPAWQILESYGVLGAPSGTWRSSW
jgi:hypothetical protein